jgi:alpha-L-rhamnosidase
VTPAGLRCAHKTDPLGVAPDRVRFSWILQGTGQAQTAYQLLLTQDDVVVWDSGRIESDATTDIPYDGPPLAGGTQYRWKVQTWDETGAASGWSATAAFETELERTTGWHAQWISLGRIREDFRPPSEPGPSDPVLNALMPAPYLRREFRVDQPVASARLYITALGLYEARLNGQRVGDAVLAPGWTDYAQRIPYQAYDVTGLLRPGDNVLAAIVADGWACGFFGFDAKQAGRHYAEAPELLAELVLRLADGPDEDRVQRVVTDAQWQGAFAAIRHADLLMGERHDLTREPRGWDAPGFDALPPVASGAGHWRPVQVRERDAIPLVADPGPPIRVTEEIAARSIATDDHGRHIVDFGQNLTGWLRLTVDGPAGARVRIRHGEVLAADGTLYTDNLRTARAVDEFTTAGGPEVLEPRFTLHGFRYAEITGYPGDIGQADITARVVHSDIPPTGSFASSAPWLDQLWRNIDWGQRGNFISVPTDCPQRDERLGWLADAQIFARTACYNRDVAAFFAKWLDDVADAQYGSGAYPDIAPRLNIPWAGAPAWADGGVIVPWTQWKMYGDTAVLDRHFTGMARWMAYLERTNPGYLRSRELGNSYNDWLAPVEDKTPPELLATAYWAYDAALMTEIAEATGRAGEAAGYRELFRKLRSSFIDAFVAADGQLSSGTQTAYVLALHMDLIPGGRRAAAAGHLAEAIRRENWHLTTGFAGVGYLLPVLCSTGHADIAYRLLGQTSAPSWRYMIDAGATTIWERWDGWTKERGFQSAWMNSFNHYALGSVGEWLYRFLLGIDQEPGTAGFGRLLVRPHPGGSLSWARGTYSSVRGPVASGWRRDDGLFTFSLDLPPNVTASVRIPSDDPAAVRDRAGSGPVSVAGYPGAPGATEAVFAVGPGSHEFTGPALTGYGR